MSNSTPSLLALLGLVAFAGYQNRGKISEMLDVARRSQPAAVPGAPPASGGPLSQLGELFRSGSAGPTLSGGLNDLVSRFKATGYGPAAESWVAPGANSTLATNDLEKAIGEDTLAELEQKTGLGRAELVRRLGAALPDVVNRFTPDGRIPSGSEAQALA